MAQSLGKNIADNRRRLGLTQEQLAQQLGVTAQAVSKWENDQSCPDIAALPRLAEIFSISTDELLGRETAKVYAGEVVTEGSNCSPGIHGDFEDKNGDGWTFKWNAGRRHGITFAAFTLLVGALTLLARLFQWDVSFWEILWPCGILAFGVQGLFPKFSAFCLGCTLFGGYSLVRNLGFWQLDIAGDLILPIVILVFGVGLLMDALGKSKKPIIQITKNGEKKTVSEFSANGERFSCDLSFGDEVRAINLPRLSGGEIDVCFGKLIVDLSGCGSLSENCHIEADCSFGEIVMLVPRRFRVESDSDTTFATLQVTGQADDAAEGVITLDADISFGNMIVRYI